MNVPRLEQAYRECRQVVERHPSWGTPESFSILLAGESHREAWKPSKVRLLLIAESHMYTDGDEESARVSVPGYPGLPSEFIRLVYCLGYGCPSLVDRPIVGNEGTRQYWELFACLAALPKPHRWEDKIAILQRLRERGVWLLDSCLLAVRRPGGNRLPAKAVRGLQEIWWDHVGREIVEEVRAESICAIGKGVASQLERLSVPLTHSILQPNGARTLEQRASNREGLENLARRLDGTEAITNQQFEMGRTVIIPGQTDTVRYSASRLEFRKRIIEPLGLDEAFEVETPFGLYRFTKAQFYESFPRIAGGDSYLVGGRYNGPKLHLQAERFRVGHSAP